MAILSILVIWAIEGQAQVTYYSQGSGLFSDNTNWNTAANGSGATASVGDETLGIHSYVIQNTHIVTVGGNFSIADLTIGDGDPDGAGLGTGSGQLTIGNSTTAHILTVNGSVTVKAGATLNTGAFNALHQLTIFGDISTSTGQDNTTNGTFDLFNSASQATNLIFGGAVTTVIAGQGIALNDITINGDQNRILNASLTVNGNFLLSGTGTTVVTSANHVFLGDFTVNNGNGWTSNDGFVDFNGTGHQDITINGSNGTALFDLVDFEFGGASPNDKRIIGGLNVQDRIRVFSSAVIDDDPGSDHYIQEVRMDGSALCTFSSTSTVHSVGGQLRHGANAATDGQLQFGDAAISIEGNSSVGAGDELIVNNDLTINSGHLVLNGIQDGTDDGIVTVNGTRSLTLADGTFLYLRGVDNFPTGFNSYAFGDNSRVIFDANFSQNVRGGAGITFHDLQMGQAEDQSGGATKTLLNDLDVNGTWRLYNGVIADLNGFDVSVAENITNDDGSSVTSASGNITLDGTDINQSVTGGVQYSLGTGSFIIDRSGTPSAIRTINIDIDIEADVFSATNTGGSATNYLIVDVDNFAVLPTNLGSGSFTIGEHVRYYTSGTTSGNNFASTANQYNAVSINANSVIRFDGAGDQNIPVVGGYGTIHLSGSGNKNPTGNITVAGDFQRVGGTPIFNDSGNTIGISGDWLMDDNYTGTMTGTIEFEGADQQISESEFNNVLFEGSGTKILAGDIDLSGALTIDGVFVNADNQNVDLRGGWTETNGGYFNQLANAATTFDGSGLQALILDPSSSFGELLLANPVGVLAQSDVVALGDVDFVNGQNARFFLQNFTLFVGGNWYLRTGSTFTLNGSSTIHFNGNAIQNLYNYLPTQNYDNLVFSGSGEKILREQVWDVNDDFTINSGTIVDAQSIGIEVAGNWSNNGTFQHNAEVTFDGAAQTISTTDFHDVDFAGSGTKALSGNINVTGNLIISSTLDVSGSNYGITVEEDWTNNGTFNEQQGTVTFVGGGSDLYSGGIGAAKSFHHLVINEATSGRVLARNNIDINGDLTIATGIFRVYFDLYVEGSFVNNGNFEQNNNSTITFDDDDSGTHSINTGGIIIRETEFNAAGATYQLTNDIEFRNNSAETVTITNGTVDLNGNTFEMGNAALTLAGGTLLVDEGAVLQIYEGQTFTNTGGALRLIGVDGSPATMTVNGDAYFDYLQNGASASFEAVYYVISSTENNGIEVTDGSVSNLSNGTFTSGESGSNAYLTLSGTALGSIVANNVVFNSGPNFNVDMTSGTGTLEFVIAGGTLAGPSHENDSPDGGGTDGFIRWTYPAGNYWEGDLSSDWHTGGNWSLGTVPDNDDFVYIDSNSLPGGGSTTCTISSAAFAERVSILGTGMTLNVNANLTVANSLETEGNFTVESGNTVSQNGGVINVAGSWSSDGTYDISNNPTLAFIGDDGAHTITTGGYGTGNQFYTLEINAEDGVVYTLGSNIRVNNHLNIIRGTLDASSGYDIRDYGDWTVGAGVFNGGSARVEMRGSGTQNISGGTFNELYFYTASSRKEINSNIYVDGTFYITNASGMVVDGNENIIFIGGNWRNGIGASGFTQSGIGTVVVNEGMQFQSDQTTTFNNLSLQGSGTKTVNQSISVNGDLNIVSTASVVINNGNTVTGTATGTMTMTNGTLQIYGINPNTNFPSGFGTYAITGGNVQYRGDGDQDIFGGIEYFDLQLFSNSASTPTTKNATSDFTVKDDLTVGTGSDSETTLSVSDGVTITLVDALSLFPGAPQIDWGTDGPTGGTLFHDDDGTGWTIDADITQFNNLVLSGTGARNLSANTNITGDFTIKKDAIFNMRTFTVTKGGAATTTLTLEEQSTLDVEVTVPNTAFPTGFDNYSVDVTSLVRLDGSSDQNVYAAPTYGNLTINTVGNATIDANLNVDGNFDTNPNTTLVDGGFDMNFAGGNVDIRNYTPSGANTVTFDGGDQNISNDNGGTHNLHFQNVVFAGTGLKTLNETLDIDGNLTIDPAVTVQLSRAVDFAGTSWVNNGTFTHTSTTLPVTFSGIATTQNVDPGTTNAFGSVVFANLFGTTNIITNGLNVENGAFEVSANATANFGSLGHTIASATFTIDGNWNTTNANLTFDRNGSQVIPGLTAQDIVLDVAGTKSLAGNWNIDDLTINPGLTLDVTNANYTITLTGSWLNSGGTFNDRAGIVAFESNSTAAKTITTAGLPFYNVTFNQSQTNTRVYTISEATNIDETLVVGNGATLDLDGKVLTLGNNDADDPPGEVHTIEAGGVIEVDAGALLQFDTHDDNNNTTDIGATLYVDGTLNVVGADGDVATITRSDGNNRINIIIDNGGAGTGVLGAQYYHFQYLYYNGLVMNANSTLDATNNLSNGTWSNMATSTAQNSTYLTIDTDNIGGGANIDVSNVTFNFDGAPTAGTHINVSRNSGLTNTITFQTVTNGLLSGETYDDDAGNLVIWPTPTTTTWVGTVDTDWYKAGNWTGGVPTNLLEAIVPLGQNIAKIDAANGTGATSLNLKIIGDGVLKLENDGDLDVEGDVIVGDGTGTAALIVAHPTSDINVQGSWSLVDPAIFDAGAGTVIFDAVAGSVTINQGTSAFNNVTIDGNAIFNLEGTDVDINGALNINSGVLTPTTTNYDYYIAGDIIRNTANGADFINTTEGTIYLNGADQTISDMKFYGLSAVGTGTKTFEKTNVIDFNFDISSTVAAQNSGDVGTIDMNSSVTINTGGVFDDGGQTTHTFAGDDWTAGAGSYSGNGSITFDKVAGGQDIESIDGTSPEFSSVTFGGTSNIELFTDINVTGDVTANNTINVLDVGAFLITNTSGPGTGTFTLDDGEIILVEGADNFPAGFGAYNMHANSDTRYYGTGNQTVRGAFTDAASNVVEINYGRLSMDHANTKTLSGNIGVQENLYFRESTVDVTAANYDIEIQGHWFNFGGGSFNARNGNVVFSGPNNQRINNDLTGTKDFYNLIVNKSADLVDVDNNGFTVQNDLNVISGEFNASGHTIIVGGNLNATGGIFTRSGTYFLNTSNTSAIIRTNGSTLNNLTIQADNNTRIYNLEDDLDVDGQFNLNAGIFNGEGTSGTGKSVSLGNGSDVVTISSGTYQVGSGGTLALGNNTSVLVKNSGRFELIGDLSNVATLTGDGGARYNFTVEDGTIAASNYLVEYTLTNGIYITATGTIDATNNFSNGAFSNGLAGAPYLRIENTQDINGAGRIENVSFADDPGNGASNIFKSIASSGTIEVYNSSGSFAGENFDKDDFNIINWTFPPTLVWNGQNGTDWFDSDNWETEGGVNTADIPSLTTDAIIPDPSTMSPFVVNFPIITDDDPLNPGEFPQVNNLTIGSGAIVTINTVATATDTELTVAGDLRFEATSIFIMNSANDRVSVVGNWDKNASALFTPGSGTVELNSQSGLKVLNNGNDRFYNLEIDVVGTIQLGNNTIVSNDLMVTTGTFNLGSNDLVVGGNFTNNGTFTSNSQKVTFDNTGGGTVSINTGGDVLFDVDIDDGGNGTTFQLVTNGLASNGDFNLLDGTLDPNGQLLRLGDDTGLDNINIFGNLTIGANETLQLGNAADFRVKNGGSFDLVGTDASNVATMTRRNSGNYTFTVESGGNISAQYYSVSYPDATGLNLLSGANLHATRNFSNGTFSNGEGGGRYLWFQFNPAGAITVEEVTFNSGPANNVRYESGDAIDLITFNNWGGLLGGADFEDDDEVTTSATTGLLRWSLSNVTQWIGGTSPDWNVASNWDNGVPTETLRVIIGSGGANDPILGFVGGGDAAGLGFNLTLTTGALLTINNGVDLTIGDFTGNDGGDVLNGGTITINGSSNFAVKRDWNNAGVFNSGTTSTVTLVAEAGTNTIATNATALNNHFNNLTLDSDNAGDGTAVFQPNEDLYIDGDFTVTDGMFDAINDVYLGGNWTVAANSFIANTSTIHFVGGNENITDNGGNSFYSLNIGGTGSKTLLSNIVVSNELVIQTGSTLDADSYTINLLGNWNNDGTFTPGTGTVAFMGTNTQILSSAGAGEVFNNFTINNTETGTIAVNLQDPVRVNSTLTLTDGVVDSEAGIITLADNATAVGYSQNSYVSGPMCKEGDDDFIFPIGDGTIFARIAIYDLTDAGNSFRAQYYDQTYSNTSSIGTGLTNVSTIEYWDVQRKTGTEFPVLGIWWEDAIRSVVNTGDLDDLKVAHWNGSQWEDLGQNVILQTGNSIAGTNAPASLSPITLASTSGSNVLSNGTLPVDLLEFTASTDNGQVGLNWSTASEINNDYFEIQRSEGGSDWEVIGKVDGNGTTNEMTNYSYVDKQPFFGKSYYRLQQFDFDGQFEYSPVVSVEIEEQVAQLIAARMETKVFPNPTKNGDINLEISTHNNRNKISIKLLDISGRCYYNSLVDPGDLGGKVNIRPDSQLRNGIYLLHVEQNGQVAKHKIIIY